jgi:hypothetical protein
MCVVSGPSLNRNLSTNLDQVIVLINKVLQFEHELVIECDIKLEMQGAKIVGLRKINFGIPLGPIFPRLLFFFFL